VGGEVWQAVARGSASWVALARALRILSTALITAGIVVLADVAMTLAWKEPISSIYGEIQQNKLEDELASLEGEFPNEAALAEIERLHGTKAKAKALANRFADQVEVGDAIGSIRIPSIDADYVLVEGTETAELQRGPGHYPYTSMPGQGGTVGVAGHRTTYLAPFRNIDDIDDGGEVILEMPYATFTYEVQRHEVVAPTDVQIVRDVGYERIVLTACHPLYSAAERYVVFAKLSHTSLFTAGGLRFEAP
jgi:sortase A